MHGDAVEDLRELDRRDAALRLRAERLRAADEAAAAVRARAEELGLLLASFRAEDARLAALEREARAEVERLRAALAEAESTLAAAAEEERPAAVRARERAADHVAVGVAAADRAAAATADLRARADAAPAGLEQLAVEAAHLGADVPGVEAPAAAADALADWGSRVHAAVFVAAGVIDAQRERLIREANELASMLLGEPTYGSTVAQVTERVLRA